MLQVIDYLETMTTKCCLNLSTSIIRRKADTLEKTRDEATKIARIVLHISSGAGNMGAAGAAAPPLP